MAKKTARIKSEKKMGEGKPKIGKGSESKTTMAEKLKKNQMNFVLFGLVLVFFIAKLFYDSEIISLLFTGSVLISAIVLTVLSFTSFGEFVQNKRNLIAVIFGILLFLVLTRSDPFMTIIFTTYYLTAMLVVIKSIDIEKAVIIAIFITAIIFRVYPAFQPYLLSLDDPYYYYKLTDFVYTDGDIPTYDPYTHPNLEPPRTLSHSFPAYFNGFLAITLGLSVHDMLMLYPVIVSAIAAILVYLFMKTLSGDWKVGAIAGYLFATMPMLLTKSVAGGTEDDAMGMLFAVIFLLFFVKGIREEDRNKNFIYSILTGFSLLALAISWQGIDYFFPLISAFVAIYMLLSVIFRYDAWNTLKVYFISGLLFIAIESLLFEPRISRPIFFGGALLLGIMFELVRIRMNKIDIKQLDLENKIHANLHLVLILVILGAVGFSFYYGIDNVVSYPLRLIGQVVEGPETTFFVDKTIQEQSQLASSDWGQRLEVGFLRYNISMWLSLICAILIPIVLVYYFMSKKKDDFVNLLRAYLLTVVFFGAAMSIVWYEARLGFSQSLSFLMLGSLIGLLLPKGRNELDSWKVVTLLVIPPLILASVYYPYEGDPFSQTKYSSGTVPEWFEASSWLGENVNPDEYILTWWDYGHVITAISNRVTITDPIQQEEYIMQTARFFYNYTNEDDALNWVLEQPWGKEKNVRWIVLDKSLVDKASALAFLGTNYYVTSDGQMTLKQSEGTPVDPFLRNPTDAVYGQYMLREGIAVCRQEYTTSTEPIIVIENGERKTITDRYLYVGYGGLSFDDGVGYDALIILIYADGTQKMQLITQDCTTKDYTEVLSTMGDRIESLGFGVRLSEQVVAPQILVHIPTKFKDAMFTKLYIYNAQGMENIDIVYDESTQQFYPYVKIFKITYNDELPEEGNEEEPVQSGEVVEIGDTVKVDYTGKYENGSVFDSSEGKDPIEFVVGSGSMIEGFDEAVVSMSLNEEKTVTIPPEKAYGFENESNHPLAGKTLIFDIMIVDITKRAEPEEAPPVTSIEEGEIYYYSDYDPGKIMDYNVSETPTIVFNCKFKRSGTFALSEGTTAGVPVGSEKSSMEKLICIFNRGMPADICEPLGIVEVNGTINIRDSQTVRLVSSNVEDTGLESCKPDNKTLVEIFHSDDSSASIAQRAILQEVKNLFGDNIEVKTYCIGRADYCLGKIINVEAG